MPDARHANLLEPEALVELFLRHPPQGFAAASEADLPVFGTDFDLLTTLEPAILVKIRRLPLFGLWSRLLRFPARFAGTTATEYAPLPKGLEPGALLDGFRERCAAGQSLLIVKDVPEVSPLLGCMSMGMVYINLTGDDLLFAQLASFSPPILLLFFVRSGLCFDLGALFSASPDGSGSLLTIGILYFFARIIGKYAGAWLGCRTAGLSQPVCRCLGLALIPQAGVSIGLAALCARTLGGGIGSDLYTIIMASSVLYELIGPGCAKLALYLSHSYTPAPKPEHRTAAVPELAPNS